MADITQQYVDWFRHSSPYIKSHRGKTFVVMLPGDCLDTPYLTNIVSDLVLLDSLGVRLVVVHGARKHIEEELQAAGIQSEFHRGMRITPKEHMSHVLKAIGTARFALEASFSSGLPNSPMYRSKVRIRGGNFITAKPQGIIDGTDFQHAGVVRNIDKEGIGQVIGQNNIALLSPLGYSLTGEVFNLSFADVAVETAIQLNADKLIAYNDDGPICDKDGNVFREMTLLKSEKFLVESQRHNLSNTYFSLRACHRACDAGVSRAHIISSSEDGALLKELFTRDGSGTMVYRDSYETIRRARIEDVVGILGLIEPLEDAGILVKRSRERLETEINYFTVMEKDNLLIGCAGLYPMQTENVGELACVAIHPEYQKDGRAAKLLTHIERQAAKLNLSKLYALTTQTAHWFIEQGFTETHVDMLPVERRSLYNYQRKSKVFVKEITP
ncbi:Amino-acid acetyltransferase [Thalassocella blandensis]|nr:Amino-acid acetyltransferase [Thalassocella blandensis]